MRVRPGERKKPGCVSILGTGGNANSFPVHGPYLLFKCKRGLCSLKCQLLRSPSNNSPPPEGQCVFMLPDLLPCLGDSSCPGWGSRCWSCMANTWPCLQSSHCPPGHPRRARASPSLTTGLDQTGLGGGGRKRQPRKGRDLRIPRCSPPGISWG